MTHKEWQKIKRLRHDRNMRSGVNVKINTSKITHPVDANDCVINWHRLHSVDFVKNVNG